MASELIFRICLFVAGAINFIPSILVFFPDRISSSYGIDIPNQNYELLLRHRAVMLGIIGSIMIFSAIAKKNYSLAVCIGMISMVSFLIIVKLVNGEVNPELLKVMKLDILAIVILLIGFTLFKLKQNQH